MSESEKIDEQEIIIEQEIEKIAEVNNSDIIVHSNGFNLEKIMRPNCKLCQAEFREEVEAWYDAQSKKNFSVIQNKIVMNKQFQISAQAVKNHLLYHYEITKRNGVLTEYEDDLQQWVNRQGNKTLSLKSTIAKLEREMTILASFSDELDGEDRRKNADIVRKLAESILLHQEKLEKMEEDMKPITVIFNQLQLIINDEMKNIPNLSTKKVLVKVLERLQESVGDMIIE